MRRHGRWRYIATFEHAGITVALSSTGHSTIRLVLNGWLFFVRDYIRTLLRARRTVLRVAILCCVGSLGCGAAPQAQRAASGRSAEAADARLLTARTRAPRGGETRPMFGGLDDADSLRAGRRWCSPTPPGWAGSGVGVIRASLCKAVAPPLYFLVSRSFLKSKVQPPPPTVEGRLDFEKSKVQPPP